MKKRNIRTKIKEVAKEALIDPTDAFCQKVEEEMENLITPEFLEKIRAEIIKRPYKTRGHKKEDDQKQGLD